MWGPLRIGVALLALGAGPEVLPPLSHNSGMTLVVRLPDMPEQRIPLAAAADVGAAGFFDRVGAGFRHLF